LILRLRGGYTKEELFGLKVDFSIVMILGTMVSFLIMMIEQKEVTNEQ